MRRDLYHSRKSTSQPFAKNNKLTPFTAVKFYFVVHLDKSPIGII